MAVLGKIRSRGMILIGIIGLGLLAFIAEEATAGWRSVWRENQRSRIPKNGGRIR